MKITNLAGSLVVQQRSYLFSVSLVAETGRGCRMMYSEAYYRTVKLLVVWADMVAFLPHHTEKRQYNATDELGATSAFDPEHTFLT
jgi:hypothetical protein